MYICILNYIDSKHQPWRVSVTDMGWLIHRSIFQGWKVWVQPIGTMNPSVVLIGTSRKLLLGFNRDYQNHEDIGPHGLVCWDSPTLRIEFQLWTLDFQKLLHFEWSPPWHLYIFLLANLLAFYLAYLLAFYLAFYLAYLLAYVLAYLLAFYLANLLAFYLAVEVRQCPLGSGARATAMWKSRLRSGSAHCDLEVAVEVRQCPLRPGSRGWGPAVPTGIWSSRWRSGGIWSSRWRSGCAHWDLDCEEEEAEEMEEEDAEAEEEENSSDKI